MPSVTVVDTSCLILLNKIKNLQLLQKLYGETSITQTVADEFNKPIPEWVNIIKIDPQKTQGLASFLDLGEASSIVAASSKENSLLIIDERKGRKAAKEMGIQITGT